MTTTDKRADQFKKAFETLGYPPEGVDTALGTLPDEPLPEDDTDALNAVLNQVGYASVMPEDSEAILKGKKPEAKAEEAEAETETEVPEEKSKKGKG